jgi:hypothetical protein
VNPKGFINHNIYKAIVGVAICDSYKTSKVLQRNGHIMNEFLEFVIASVSSKAQCFALAQIPQNQVEVYR